MLIVAQKSLGKMLKSQLLIGTIDRKNQLTKIFIRNIAFHILRGMCIRSTENLGSDKIKRIELYESREKILICSRNFIARRIFKAYN